MSLSVAEMCVEYQLYAQALVPEKFPVCAAYGNGAYHYIPTAGMFAEGGYEPKASITTPVVESRLKKAIKDVLDPLMADKLNDLDFAQTPAAL